MCVVYVCGYVCVCRHMLQAVGHSLNDAAASHIYLPLYGLIYNFLYEYQTSYKENDKGIQ